MYWPWGLRALYPFVFNCELKFYLSFDCLMQEQGNIRKGKAGRRWLKMNEDNDRRTELLIV